MGGEHKPDTTLQPGAHEYPFQYQLPPTAPTSFKSFAAFTRYSARAELRRDKANAQTAESVIVVYEPVDLNLLMPHIAEPAAKENSKYFWTLGSRSGPLTMSIKVPSQGYVPGQTIEFEVEVDNKSTFVVYRVEVALYKAVAVVDVGHFDLGASVPIVIGTIAVRDK
ncbi:hypothetical protein FOCC_FOCC005058 [Frankliniella occidentalis]|nr:hypothetical protein FOCC_FOCC005058 [Frankliniella occidentalis]